MYIPIIVPVLNLKIKNYPYSYMYMINESILYQPWNELKQNV